MQVKVNDDICYCPKCDAEIGITLEDLECGSETIDYCSNCGTKLEWEETYQILEEAEDD